MALPPEKVFSNPTRTRIIEILIEGAASPAQLSKRIDEGRGQTSYHVAVLAEAGFIRSVKTREGRGFVEHFYEPTPAARDYRERS